MTAQTNDSVSAFAYPDPNSSPITPTSTSSNDPSSSSVASTLVSSTLPTESTSTLPIPTPVADMNPTTSPTDSVISPVPQLDTQVSASTDASLPMQKEEPKEEHDSPLQALAKKLAKLREELIQEVPKKEDFAPVSLDVPVEPTTLVATESTSPTIPEPVMYTPVVKDEAADLAALNQVPVIADNTVIDTSAVPTPVVDMTSPLMSTPTPVESVVPEVPVATTPATTGSVLEQLYPEVIEKPADVTQSASTLVTPMIQDKTNVVDENDNSVVDPMKVEMAASTSKYPLSINKIMDIAIERDASDIQVSVGYPVMIRIDGSLISVNDQVVTPANSEELILPVLSEQKKELLEVNREVDLAYSPLHNAGARFRINAYYSKNNLTAAFRLIPSKIRTIEELNLPPIYNQLTKLGQGFVLVTGPTGHGKSTTLAAMIQNINLTRATHIITIEDPIEYIFQPAKAIIDQREMHDDTHSWTVALKSALRQDPDVILVGEMRDYETIASAITLAETGHLVFATLHTNSAAQTIDRIIDVFPENQQAQIRTQLANILEAVIAQRLLPIEGGGRRAVSEIMLGTPAVRNLIREGKTHQIDNVIRTSADVGMFSLEQSLVKLVRDGMITMERAQEYAVHPEEVVRLLKS